MRQSWYKIALAVMVVLNLVLGHQLYQVKFGQTLTLEDPQSYIIDPRLPEVEVMTRSGMQTSLPRLANHKSPTLLVFFSPNDCPNCFSERTLWQEINERGIAHVSCVVTSPDTAEFWQWESQVGISLDIYIDTSFAITDSMGFKVSPIKVLVDANGIPVWADPPRLSKPEQDRFWGELNYAIKEHL